MDLDLRSEFLCQSSLDSTEHTDSPPNTSYTWDISHTLATLYHPYTHKPAALTKYLKHKLQVQRAKHQSHSHPAHVEQNVPLEHNNSTHSCPFIATTIVPTSTFPGHNVNIPGAHTIPGTAITIPALSSESLSQSMACGANQ